MQETREIPHVPFTEDMKKDYTILVPNMLPVQLKLITSIMKNYGYNMEVLETEGPQIAECGLKNVHNDTCYPALLVIGQFIDALESGKYDLHKVAVVITQTGGGCRATNYIGFIRRALEKAGMEYIPVVSINMGGIETNPGFKLDANLLTRAAFGAIFGDIFMRCVYHMRPYEKEPGSVNAVHQKWIKKCQNFLSTKKLPNYFTFRKMCREIVDDFDRIPITDEKKPRVGIVGEILVKFSPLANNHVVELLEAEGAEAVMPDLLDFMLYCFYNQIYKAEHLGTKKSTAKIAKMGIWAVEKIRGAATDALKKSKRRHLLFMIWCPTQSPSYPSATRPVKDGF